MEKCGATVLVLDGRQVFVCSLFWPTSVRIIYTFSGNVKKVLWPLTHVNIMQMCCRGYKLIKSEYSWLNIIWNYAGSSSCWKLDLWPSLNLLAETTRFYAEISWCLAEVMMSSIFVRPPWISGCQNGPRHHWLMTKFYSRESSAYVCMLCLFDSFLQRAASCFESAV